MYIGETAYDNLRRTQVRGHQDEKSEELSFRIQPGETVLLQRQSMFGEASRMEDRGYRLVLGT